MPPFPHECIIVAGSFDILHDGHHLLFHAAFSHGARVEIWLTDDAMVCAKAARLGCAPLTSWAARAARVAAWADAQTEDSARDFFARAAGALGDIAAAAALPVLTAPYAGRYSMHELSDALGPASTDARFTAVACSEETRAGVDAVNAARTERGLPVLDVIVVPLWMEAGGAAKLSSSAMRKK